MANKKIECSDNKAESVKAFLKACVEFIFPKGVATSIAIFIFLNFILMPIISYDKNTDEFTVAYRSRAISLYARPQMVVRYGDTVILLTHLMGYYEHENIYFKDNKASLTKANTKYAERLMSYVRAAVLEELREEHSDESIAEIDGQLFVYMSMICGIQYQTRFGNLVNKYCIIESDGMLVDCAPDSDKVKDRLYDYEIVLGDDTGSISTSEDVNKLVGTVVEGVELLYDNRA